MMLLLNVNLTQAQVCPLSGLATMETLKRPVMIIVDNSILSLPQSGLEKADLVYEFPTNGDETRLVAIFYRHLPDSIGPVVEAKPYFVEKAYEYNAILVHADADERSYQLLEELGVPNIDEFALEEAFWTNTQQLPPLDIYTGYSYLKPYLAEFEAVNITSRFSFGGISIQLGTANNEKIEINYSSNCRVFYQYSAWEGFFKRYFNNTPHLMDDGAALTVDNLVIQFVNVSYNGANSDLDILLRGSGRILFFKDGELTLGTWLKAGPGWTTYVDNRGRSLRFNPGVTWIQIVPQDRRVNY